MFFQSLHFACELAIERWRIEVVEAQVGDSISLIHRHADRGCHYCISALLIEISFHVQYMCILNMNIESMDIFTHLYMIDYICYSISNRLLYIMRLCLLFF